MSRKSRANRATAPATSVELVEVEQDTPAPKSRKGKAAKTSKVKAEREVQVGGVTVRKNGKLSARGLTCLCGCGDRTTTPDARFISGHDAKLRKILLNGGECPDIARPFFEAGESLGGVGFEGGEFVDLKVTA